MGSFGAQLENASVDAYPAAPVDFSGCSCGGGGALRGPRAVHVV